MTPGEDQPQQPPNIETHFSWLRTRMSADRTLEAWIRNGVSLIGFGFTVVQFFDRLNGMKVIARERIPGISRCFGLLLIGIGTLGVAAAVWQHVLFLRYLQSEQFRAIPGEEAMPGWSPSIAVAIVLAIFGVVLLIAMVV